MRARRGGQVRGKTNELDVMDFGGVWMRHVDRKCAESSPARVLTLQLIHVQYCFQSPVRGEVTRCASRRLVMCNRNTNRARHKSVPEAESVRIQQSVAMNLKITVAPRFLSSPMRTTRTQFPWPYLPIIGHSQAESRICHDVYSVPRNTMLTPESTKKELPLWI